jgi:hypothetical protein
VCDCSDQAAHYHNLGPKLGASLLTRHIGWKQKKKERKKGNLIPHREIKQIYASSNNNNGTSRKEQFQYAD